MSVPVAGGSVSTLVDPKMSVGLMTADAQYVYFTLEEGSIWKVPIAGGQPVVLGTGLGTIGGGLQIAVDAQNVYYPAYDGIFALPITGGTPTRVVAMQGCMGVAVDAHSIYWTTLPGGAVMKAAKAP
jgi:hypothetical protein